MAPNYPRIQKPPKTKYDGLKVGILRGLLSIDNMPTTGKKAELISRLFQADNNKMMLEARKALQRPPATMQPSPYSQPEERPDTSQPRRNHTSYYESLDTAQLVCHLHERGLSVQGDNTELVGRLKEYDWDGSESGYSSSDDEGEDLRASCYHETKTQPWINYDGIGLHPSILEGLRIQRFLYDPGKGLQLHCDRGCFRITFCGFPRRTSVGPIPGWDHFKIWLDKVLQNGLKSVQELDKEGSSKEDSSAEGEKRNGLLIVKSVVAVRMGRSDEYRVLGLQCEGMSQLGYVYSDNRDASYRKFSTIDTIRFDDVALEMKKSGTSFED
ncbi:hypothetical protein BDR22DRAFT_884257 [Usnea florida]